MAFFKVALFCVVSTFSLAFPTFGAGQHIMQSPVPPDKRIEARSLTNPLPESPDILAQGKALYEGRARCVHCHGQNALRRTLTKEEIFSIIKFGVPGTSHIAFQHLLSDEEIWPIVHYQLRNSRDDTAEMRVPRIPTQ